MEGGGGGIEEQNTTTVEFSGTSIVLQCFLNRISRR